MDRGLAAVFISCVIALGCATTTLSQAHDPMPAIQHYPTIKLLVVPRAEEARPLGGRSRLSVGLLVLIPFVPYAHQQFTPERYLQNSTRLNHDFLRDVSDTVAKDLQAAGIARVVTSTTDAPREPDEEVYILKLTLDEGIWHRKITAYGLSIAGAIAWMFAPVSYGSVELAITAEVFAPSRESLGSTSFRASAPVREWVWVPHPFLRMLPEAFAQIAPGLREFVANTLRSAQRGVRPTSGVRPSS